MIYGEQQQAEIKTIKERPFTLRLSDADMQRLAIKAAAAGMSMEQLLASFIGDLVDGTYSHGSDERMMAQDWYDRCGFAYAPVDDIARLASNGFLEGMIEDCRNYKNALLELEDCKEAFADPECDDTTEGDVRYAEKYLADCRSAVEGTMKYSNCTGSLEEVVAAVTDWVDSLEKIVGK